jgi:thioredoxin-like negative regulator of GroEL
MKLIKFYADWCGPCKILSPTIDKIVAEKGLTLEYESVNVDDNPERANDFNIKGIPAVVIVSDNGTVKTTIFGAQPEDAYLSALSEPLETLKP